MFDKIIGKGFFVRKICGFHKQKNPLAPGKLTKRIPLFFLQEQFSLQSAIRGVKINNIHSRRIEGKTIFS